MNKFVIFALYVMILTISFQYFFPSEKKLPQDSNVYLTIQDDTIVIPNIPKISLVNASATGISIMPCRDIHITIDSQPITGIADLSPDFCKEVMITAGSTKLLPFSDLFRMFASREGKYMISATTPLGDRSILVEVSAPGAFRSFLTTIVYDPIYNLFVALLTFLPGHPLGWAILIITLIIRFILLVPQHHMLQSQKKLQIIQPKIKELQEKYKSDQSKLGMEMIELYKKEGVNPMGSCLPLLIQMPILIGLYWVISGISDPSNFYHLYSFFSHFDPRTVDAHFYGLDLLQIG